MKLSHAKGQLLRLSERLNYSLVVNGVMLLSNTLLVVLVWYALLHQERIITPFNSTSGYVTSDSKVDVRYLDLMSMNLMEARLNVTPETVDANNVLLLSYVSSSQYAAFLEQLNHDAREIKRGKTSSVFYRDGIKSTPETLTTVISGTLKRWSGLNALPSVKRTYVLQYNYSFGRLTLKGCKEISDEKN